MGTSSTVLLPYTPASVAIARRCLIDDLLAAGIGDRAAHDAALVVSELLSNALRHARPLPGGHVQVGWLLVGGMVEVAVSDGGAVTRPRAAPASLSSLGGRGLSIVSHLTWRWGVRADDDVTTVWALLPAPVSGHADGTAAAVAHVAECRSGDTHPDAASLIRTPDSSGWGRERRLRRAWRGRWTRHGPAAPPGHAAAADNPPN